MAFDLFLGGIIWAATSKLVHILCGTHMKDLQHKFVSPRFQIFDGIVSYNIYIKIQFLPQKDRKKLRIRLIVFDFENLTKYINALWGKSRDFRDVYISEICAFCFNPRCCNNRLQLFYVCSNSATVERNRW